MPDPQERNAGQRPGPGHRALARNLGKQIRPGRKGAGRPGGQRRQGLRLHGQLREQRFFQPPRESFLEQAALAEPDLVDPPHHHRELCVVDPPQVGGLLRIHLAEALDESEAVNTGAFEHPRRPILFRADHLAAAGAAELAGRNPLRAPRTPHFAPHGGAAGYTQVAARPVPGLPVAALLANRPLHGSPSRQARRHRQPHCPTAEGGRACGPAQ